MALSSERKKLLDKLVQNGETLKAIQNEYGFNYRTVRKYYPDYRVMGSPESSGSTLNPKRKKLLDDLVKSGATITEMKRTYGFHNDTIRRYYPGYRSLAPYTRETYYTIDRDTRTLVRSLVDERASLKEIIETTGLTRGQVLWLEPSAPWTRYEAGKWRTVVEGAWEVGIPM